MSSSVAIPEALRRNLAGAFGDERATAWLAGLPALVAEVGEQWALTVGEAFPGLSFNWVAPCRLSDGTEAVLKLGIPDPEYSNEARALRAYAARGAVHLIAEDEPRGAHLLERLCPGDALTTVQDEVAATGIAAKVIRAIRCAPPDGHAFPTVAGWALGFARLRAAHDGMGGPIPEPVLARAEETYRDLLAAPTGEVLLHGDLHHGNILSHGDGWLAIDPKGVVGEPEYECGALLRNPRTIVDDPEAARILRRRAAQLADALGFDRRRVLAWASAQMVLSVVWSLEGDDRAALRWLPLAAALTPG